ncbi:serine hydrolase [soil metagenome]
MGSSRRVVQALILGVSFVLVGVLVWFIATPVPLPVVLFRSQGMDEQIRSSDRVITSLVPDGGPGCSAAVGRDGTVAWAGAAGLADIPAGIPVTTDTRFEIASVTKQFTATAILMLQRQGLLTVADPISSYVDGLPDWGDEVTIDELIHHTSRISDFWVELDDIGIGFGGAADQATALAAISRVDELEEGEGFLYSNSNYVLLAEVVTRVTGLSLPDFLAQNIFQPLGLNMVMSPTLAAPDIALPYDDNHQLFVSGWTLYGPTGIITTPSELVRWGDQYRTGNIIQDDFSAGAVYEAEGEYYAAAMDIEVDGDLNHTGLWGGYISEFTVSEDRHTVIAVTCNGHNGNRFGIADALWAIWRPVA